MSVPDPDDGWPDPRRRPPGGDVGSVLEDRAAEGRPITGPPASRHPYLTLVLTGPLVLAGLVGVGLLLSGTWSTLLVSPVRLFLVVLGILLPVVTFLVFHRRRPGAHPPPGAVGGDSPVPPSSRG